MPRDKFKEKFGRSPKIYDVVISDGARRLELKTSVIKFKRAASVGETPFFSAFFK